MKRYFAVLIAIAIVFATITYQRANAQATPPAKQDAAAAAPAANPCAMPTRPSPNPAQTAWQIFVAANCPAPGGKLVWETWVEQLDLYPASGTTGPGAKAAKRLHGSPLAAVVKKQAPAPQLAPNTECNTMNAPPPNVVSGATVCEEVHMNPAFVAYLTAPARNYQVRSGQTAAAQKGVNIQFPAAAVEVKVDWIPASDFTNPPFTCNNPPATQTVYTETIDGVCYALAGMHVSSKLWPNWIWATFEPQNLDTNPNRCITFGPCNDSWGSIPAQSKGGAGGNTKLTQPLANMMAQAKLAPAFLNYRLDGVQVTFGTAQNPTLLGNSIIEGENVGMTAGTASCITCHSESSIKNDGTDGITTLSPKVGPKINPPAGWIARDFVWSMLFACPNGGPQCTNK